MNKISLCLLLLVAAGCQLDQNQIIPISAESAPMTVKQDASSLEQRFSDSRKMDPVTTITMWAQRYEELSKQAEQLRKENARLLEENNRLQQDFGKMKLELEQTGKEVGQSNTLLQEAHVELSKWKSDVLGFREEMRQAQTAQMQALSRVLRILGAESTLPQAEAAKDSKVSPQEGTKQ
jgi:chromosome segregation ATPase